MSVSSCTDQAPLAAVLERYPAEEASLIQVLQDVHRAYNYLPCEVLGRVADALGVPIAKVYSVGTFYKAFSLTPQGRVIVKVCTGTACHIRGATQLIDELGRKLSLKPGETTEDLSYTLKTVNCVGACAMAPVLIVGERYHGGAKAAKIDAYLEKGSADDGD